MDGAGPVYSIIAGTLYGNRGAQAMTEAVVGRLRADQPGAHVHVFSYYPAADRRLLRPEASHVTVWSATPAALVTRLLFGSLAVGAVLRALGRNGAPGGRWRDLVLRAAPGDVAALARSRALLDVAGVSFIDGRERFLPFNVLTLLPGWALGVPVVKLPQAVGPLRGRLTRAAARVVLPRLRVLWARGARTGELLAESGIPGVRVAAGDDLAFAHRPEYALTAEPEPAVLSGLLASIAARRAHADVRAVVAVCPSSVLAVRSRASGGDYERMLARVVADLSRDGVQVVLVPNASRAADVTGERNNDLPVIRRVLAAAGAVEGPAPFAVDIDLGATAVKEVLGACDAVLVSRFHAMVGALSLAVPVVVLGWSHKYREVMARFGQEHRVYDHAGMAAGEVLDAVRDALDDAGGITAAIRAGLPEVVAGALRPLDALRREDLGAADAR